MKLVWVNFWKNLNLGNLVWGRKFYIWDGMSAIYPLNYETHKMVKHTQTIRRQQPTICLSGFDPFVGWRLEF